MHSALVIIRLLKNFAEVVCTSTLGSDDDLSAITNAVLDNERSDFGDALGVVALFISRLSGARDCHEAFFRQDEALGPDRHERIYMI
jgi:hypothetical protein